MTGLINLTINRLYDVFHFARYQLDLFRIQFTHGSGGVLFRRLYNPKKCFIFLKTFKFEMKSG